MAKEENKKTTTNKKSNNSKKVTKSVASETTKSVSQPKVEKKVESNKSEENNYGRTLLAAVLILIIFVGGYLTIQYQKNGGFNKQKYEATKDEVRFKEEYEKLNGTTRSNGKKHKEVSILDDNNIVYISVDEAADILDDGSGIIYFGFSACPWCRNIVPVLLNAMNSTSLDKIYYVDVRPNDDAKSDIRDTYTLDTRNKAKRTKDASQSYYNILLALANELSDYVLTTDKGKEVNTGEKRLYAPTVVAVLNGELIGFHEGSVESHKIDDDGNVPDLTKEQEDELFNIYTEMISKYLGDECSTNDEEGC